MSDSWFPNVAAVMKERDALRAQVQKGRSLARKVLGECEGNCNRDDHRMAARFLKGSAPQRKREAEK